MKILVLGSGGREHALAWKLHESQQMEQLYCAPGNAGIAQEAECLPVDLSQTKAMVELAKELHADLTIVGPEAPLVAGVVDEFEKEGLNIIGPSKAAARLEGSKIFAKEFMARHGIPTAQFAVAESFEEAVKALARFPLPVAVKADGLAAGKGVVVAHDRAEAEQALEDFMRRKTLGSAGDRVVIEEFLMGEETSFIVLTDGRGILPLVPTQDHKALLDGDQGPNTGGMGAYSDDSLLSESMHDEILRSIVAPTLAGMEMEGSPYRGFLYFGLMMTLAGPMLLEYNVRLGDPETQPILMRLRSDLADLLVTSRQGQLSTLDVHWSPNPAVCVVLASRGYPAKPEVDKPITGYEAAEAFGGVKIFHAGTRMQDHQLLTAGGRVMGVTAVATDLPSAIQRAYAGVGKLQFEGMHYRKDIGAKALRGIPSIPAPKRGRVPKGERPSSRK
ncbi:MAG: phosphoribosylamine--glycine ligase [Terriglobia bacterium]|jgi:phosphoribosylamine--glycine ligase